MKLADALLLRSDMNKKIASRSRRALQAIARFKMAKTPGKILKSLLKSFSVSFKNLKSSLGVSTVLNLVVKIAGGKTMMEAIAERDRINAQHKLLKEAAEGFRVQTNYYSNSEIK